MSYVANATVFLCGGLGNQCFQFATLLAYATETKRNVILCNESAGSRQAAYWHTVFTNLFNKSMLQNRLPTIKIVNRQEYDVITKTYACVSEQNFSFAPLEPSLATNDVVLKGYFQSHLYFESIEPILLMIFNPAGDRCVELDKTWHNIVPIQYKNVALNRFVSIHVRRGDYLHLQEIHLVLRQDYYCSAMQIFDESTIFIVFSDDIAWCLNAWGKKENFVFVPNTLYDYDAFQIMMHYCLGGHIIANSTFSWWPAYVDWLISSKTRRIVAPKKWFGSRGPQQHSLHVPGWLIIDN